jgi:hypothetical protein
MYARIRMHHSIHETIAGSNVSMVFSAAGSSGHVVVSAGPCTLQLHSPQMPLRTTLNLKTKLARGSIRGFHLNDSTSACQAAVYYTTTPTPRPCLDTKNFW